MIVEFEVYFHLRKSNAKAEKILIVLNFCNQVWPLTSYNFNRASCNMASSGLFQELFLLETDALIVSNSQGIERFLITSLIVRRNVIYRMYLTAPPMLRLEGQF